MMYMKVRHSKNKLLIYTVQFVCAEPYHITLQKVVHMYVEHVPQKGKFALLIKGTCDLALHV